MDKCSERIDHENYGQRLPLALPILLWSNQVRIMRLLIGTYKNSLRGAYLCQHRVTGVMDKLWSLPDGQCMELLRDSKKHLSR